MAEFWYRLVTPRKRHCLARLTLYVHICHVCDGLYASRRVKATRRYRFKTLDRKPRPRSQSYKGPTTVGPDTFCYSFHSLKCEYQLPGPISEGKLWLLVIVGYDFVCQYAMYPNSPPTCMTVDVILHATVLTNKGSHLG